MNAYVYQAALLCDSCGPEVRARLKDEGKAPADPSNEWSYDSGNFPKGPYQDGGGEADCPQHCDACHVFLANPLTDDGLSYVKEAVERAVREGRKDSAALTDWAPFYDVPGAVDCAHCGKLILATAAWGDGDVGDDDPKMGLFSYCSKDCYDAGPEYAHVTGDPGVEDETEDELVGDGSDVEAASE